MIIFRLWIWKSILCLTLIGILLLSACMPVEPASTGAESATPTEEPAGEPAEEPVATSEAATDAAPSDAAPLDTNATDASAAGEQELENVQVVILPFMSFAPFYIAQEEGFFAEQGLDVEFINMTQQDAVIPGMLSGQIDIASGLLNAGTLNTIVRGGQIKIVADKGYIDPEGCDNIGIIARASLVDQLDVNDPATFAGLRVTPPLSSWVDYYFDMALREIGMSAADFEHVSVPSPAQLEALEQEQLDILVNNEPWITRFLEAGHQMILTPVTELLPEGQSAVMFYGESMLGERSDVGKRFMVAYLQGVRQYNEGATERNVDIIARNINLEPELLNKMCWPAIRNDGDIDVENVLAFQDWAIEVGYLDEGVMEEQFWDPQFIEYANEVLGPAE